MRKSIKKCVVAGATMTIMASMAISAYGLSSGIQAYKHNWLAKNHGYYHIVANGVSLDPGTSLFEMSNSRGFYTSTKTFYDNTGNGVGYTSKVLEAQNWDDDYYYHGQARDQHYEWTYAEDRE